jgi:hypothetical protein
LVEFSGSNDAAKEGFDFEALPEDEAAPFDDTDDFDVI